MKALLWKDFRMNLPIVIAAVFCCTLPYLVGASLVLAEKWPVFPSAEQWGSVFSNAGRGSLHFLQVIIGLLGANALAAERADRSAEFLFSLPPSRRQILASKFLLALGVSLVPWMVYLFSEYVICPWLTGHPGFMIQFGFWRLTLAAVGVFLFGAAWAGSSFLSSTAYALGMAIGLFFAVSVAVIRTALYLHWPAEGNGEFWFQGMCVAMGVVMFAAGSCYYLRRVEP
jgi:ABC-type transport system involved in multi-copper enzyme maturation permease subunit